MSNMVRSLENQEIISKVKSESDARSTLISLNPKGSELIDPIHLYWEEFQDSLFRGFSDDDKRTMKEFLTRLEIDLETIK